MEWTQAALYVAVGLLALVLACWIVNLVLTSRRKQPSMLLNRLMYLLAIAAIILNAVRSAVVYSGKSMLVANLVALACIIISLVRTERVYKYGEPEDEEEA